ncbi:hypothetical protein A6R68_11902 [Neotoma lepida]|uniref:Uncharacterized protein n=1 Tax=Neotoma lepida TaxID=56216 RepID=A0A1A6FTR4_NEOLE|nr:hypothetical protein A6R68_11902 [Neotoma lepida]
MDEGLDLGLPIDPEEDNSAIYMQGLNDSVALDDLANIKGMPHHFVDVLEDPRVTWETMEETEAASPQADPGAARGLPLEEEMSSTKLERGSIPIWAVETRTPGEQNTTRISH